MVSLWTVFEEQEFPLKFFVEFFILEFLLEEHFAKFFYSVFINNFVAGNIDLILFCLLDFLSVYLGLSSGLVDLVWLGFLRD